MTTTTTPSILSLCFCSAAAANFSRPILYPNLFRPNLNSRRNPRLLVLHKSPLSSRSALRVPALSSINDGTSELNHDSFPPSSPSDEYFVESSIDVKLPRRSLLVQFTCNSCGERTKRLVNRVAYERGTVFVQCAGCRQYHKLVDNLSLVVEHDFRNDFNED
ncbi:hypothetical protein Nepgr_029381 [Nepenthes gracilis]|uniref:DNL-type domain-containing protein n=1 Tax=Nepenthes gracilis TaxID=150966 RepID=A0AAD3Y379_NEPGR|nr:hypothetical protein Nepgr_029381 [Nepenthes gracilis]